MRELGLQTAVSRGSRELLKFPLIQRGEKLQHLMEFPRLLSWPEGAPTASFLLLALLLQVKKSFENSLMFWTQQQVQCKSHGLGLWVYFLCCGQKWSKILPPHPTAQKESHSKLKSKLDSPNNFCKGNKKKIPTKMYNFNDRRHLKIKSKCI